MKLRNVWIRYMAPATGDEGGGNAGGGAGGEGDAAAAEGGEADKAGEVGEKATDKPADSKISDTEAKLLREVMQNKQARRDAETQVKELKEQLAKFDGINLEEVKAVLDERAAAAERKLVEQGNWDALKAQMVEQHNASIQAIRAELEGERASKSALVKQLEEISVGAAFTGSSYIQSELVLTPAKTRVIYGQHFDVEDGRVVAYDKPRGHEGRTQLVDAQGEPMGFDDALRRLVEADPERDELLRARAKPGAGSGSEKPTGEKRAGAKNESLHGIDRINRGLANLIKPRK